MKSIRTPISLAVFSAIAAITAASATSAWAQSESDTAMQSNSAAWYMGAEIGRATAKIDDSSIAAALAADGSTSTSINNNDRSTGYKLFGGYQFNDYVALEGGFFDLGKFSYDASTVPAGTVHGGIKLKGINLDLIGFIPLTERLSGFGRVGMNYARASDNFNSSGLVETINPNPSQKKLNVKFGAGLEYKFTQALAMRVEAERYRVDDAIGNTGDIDLYSVGLVYRFGEPTQMHAAPAPAVVQPAPMPVLQAPVAVIAPPPPPPPPRVPVKVSFSADSLYEFNQSDIKPAGRQAIDQFTSELKGTDFAMITVTGHTDRIGTHAENMKLSARRADKVKEYMIESAGIPADKIQSRGVDGEDPVTKPADCPGKKVTKALIACLQPDRRVDIEVSGTK